MLLAFGQSNADVHHAGPRLATDIENRFPIVMPNDGYGIRGPMGRKRTKSITGFDHVSKAPDEIQSLLVSAAARLLHDLPEQKPDRVIVRSEAKGGRRFWGVSKGEIAVDGIFRTLDGSFSPIFLSLLRTIDECIIAAREDGAPIRTICIAWLHGESDRAMERTDYIQNFLSLRDEVENFVDERGVELRWCLVQPAGTGADGHGNRWPNRLSMMDLAQQHENIDLTLSGYAYELADASHFSALGKLRLGENFGRVLAQRLAGEHSSELHPIRASLEGVHILLEFSSSHPLVIDQDSIPAPELSVFGFSVDGCSGLSIMDVEVVGEKGVRLVLDRVPEPSSLIINYAYQPYRRDNPNIAREYPVGRGCLRTEFEVQSIFDPGVKLYDWVPGFSVAFRELAEGV